MGYELHACHQPCPAESHNVSVSLKLVLFFFARDQAQLDAASVSSIQVVGVVEALIQNADTLFPGGDVLYCHLQSPLSPAPGLLPSLSP